MLHKDKIGWRDGVKETPKQVEKPKKIAAATNNVTNNNSIKIYIK